MNLNPQLIFGAIVEEADTKYHHNSFENMMNEQADKWTLDNTEEALRVDYIEVLNTGIINDKTKYNTLIHPTMRDVGRANIRVAVAIQEMEKYLSGFLAFFLLA